MLFSVYFSIPVSASSGDDSVHRAVQLLVRFIVEKSCGLHQGNASDAMKKAMAARMDVHNLNLTENQEVSNMFIKAA